MEAPLLYVAGGIELVGGALVAIGLQTRWAAFVCSGMMAAAYWMAHGMQAFTRSPTTARPRFSTASVSSSSPPTAPASGAPTAAEAVPGVRLLGCQVIERTPGP